MQSSMAYFMYMMHMSNRTCQPQQKLDINITKLQVEGCKMRRAMTVSFKRKRKFTLLGQYLQERRQPIKDLNYKENYSSLK